MSLFDNVDIILIFMILIRSTWIKIFSWPKKEEYSIWNCKTDSKPFHTSPVEIQSKLRKFWLVVSGYLYSVQFNVTFELNIWFACLTRHMSRIHEVRACSFYFLDSLKCHFFIFDLFKSTRFAYCSCSICLSLSNIFIMPYSLITMSIGCKANSHSQWCSVRFDMTLQIIAKVAAEIFYIETLFFKIGL